MQMRIFPFLQLVTTIWQHTADNISLALKHITEEWGLTDKVVAGHTEAQGYSTTVVEAQAQAEHNLIQSVDICWNSFFYMLERLCEQNEAVTTAVCLLGRTAFMLK